MFYDLQEQVLVGTILGGSSLVKPPKGKNYYLSMRSKDRVWLEYKMAMMPKFFKQATLRKYGTTYRCNSYCFEKLTEVYKTMYTGNKRTITMPVLDSLMDMAWSIWFLDGGSKTGRGRKNAYLNTTKFGPDGTKLICRYFNEVGVPCNINKDGIRLKILFTVDGTEAFFKVAAHQFPTFMHHRLN